MRDLRGIGMTSQRTRARMVQRLREKGIRDERVLGAMAGVPRHLFVEEALASRAYEDTALPIGFSQTISQPFVVARMVELVLQQGQAGKVLEVGTGCGYQAAVLAELCAEVYSIEIVEPLADQARKRLESLGYANVQTRHGDGYRGWPEKAPFDVIVVAAAPDHIPPALVEQLAPGGRLVIPVGEFWQELTLVEKDADGNVRQSTVAPVAFVPMTGEAQRE